MSAGCTAARPRCMGQAARGFCTCRDTSSDAEVRALRARLAESTAAAVALAAEADELRVDKAALAKLIDENPSLRIRELEATRKMLAEAKRLGLEACEFIHSAIRNAPDANSTDLGDMSASTLGARNADRIAAALEAL